MKTYEICINVEDSFFWVGESENYEAAEKLAIKEAKEEHPEAWLEVSEIREIEEECDV